VNSESDGPERSSGNVTTPAIGAGAAERSLVLVHTPHVLAIADLHAVAAHARETAPTIATFVVSNTMLNDTARRKAAERPSLIFSPVRLKSFVPLRGKVYQGRAIGKLEQLRLLATAGVRVPKTTVITPKLALDPAEWGPFVIVKPTFLGGSSRGKGIQLMRTERVRYIAPANYPPDHPGRGGPMIAQQFIDTGKRIAAFRVLTLFGEPLYCQFNRSETTRPSLDAGDQEIERAVMATQTVDKDKRFVIDEEVIALARAAHAVFPDVPLKGCDILKDEGTGKLYVLELNPGGNVWHFSSDYLAKVRTANGPEFEAQRLKQFDALRTAGRLLAERTMAEAV
jgi:hypothetical protein